MYKQKDTDNLTQLQTNFTCRTWGAWVGCPKSRSVDCLVMFYCVILMLPKKCPRRSGRILFWVFHYTCGHQRSFSFNCCVRNIWSSACFSCGELWPLLCKSLHSRISLCHYCQLNRLILKEVSVADNWIQILKAGLTKWYIGNLYRICWRINLKLGLRLLCD